MGYPSKIGQYRDGTFRKNVIEVSTASTASYVVREEDSGSVLRFGVVSTVAVQLPRISSKWLGLTYDIFFSTADATGDYTIDTSLDSSAGIWIMYSSGGVGSPSTITPATTDGPHGMRVTAISSVVWMGEPLMVGGSSAKPHGKWTTG